MNYKRNSILAIGLVTILLAFQNCTDSSPVNFSNDLSKLGANETGQPYDGKIYIATGNICVDQSHVHAKIILHSALRADLVRQNCEDLSSPVTLGSNDFQLNPSNPDEMRFQDVTFYAQSPTGTVIGKKLDVSTAVSDTGFSYQIDADLGAMPDTMTDGTASKLRLYEDGMPMGPAHSLHVDIRNYGQGRFSYWLDHWNNADYTALRFSASDNSDPRTNGRVYTYDVAP